MLDREQIIEMAGKAGFSAMYGGLTPYGKKCLITFAALVAAAEREECAAILDTNMAACEVSSLAYIVLQSNAAASRARGQQ